MDQTKEMILKQLQENTGRAMCDSGDAYGRHWQQNATKTWEDLTKNSITLEAWVYTHGPNPELELNGTISLASWMENNLEYWPELQEAYDNFNTEEDDHDLMKMEAFVAKHNAKKERGYAQFEPSAVNSYNTECDLSQTVQFIEFSWEDEDGNIEKCCLFQVHGGCDVRGGYSAPKAYKVRCEYLGDWRVDSFHIDGASWDQEGCPIEGADSNLFKGYSVFDFKFESTLEKDLEALKQTDHDNEETRQKMRDQNTLLEDQVFEEAVETYAIVVRNHNAYFNGTLIQAVSYSLMG